MRKCSFAALAGLAAFVTSLFSAADAAAQSAPAAPEKIAVGDWLLSPSMQVRVRGEYRRDAADLGGLDYFGRLSPRVRDAWVVMERSRLGLGVERGAVKAQFTLQDARAFGGPIPNATFAGLRDVGQTSPYEAYAEMRSSGARPTYLRLGRQAVVWGEGRLIGNADFSPTGRSLDAARGHVAVGNFDFEALAAVLEMPGTTSSALGDTRGPQRSGVQLYGLLARWTIDPLLKIEAIGLARVARSSSDTLDGSRFALARLSGERFTGGLRVAGEGKGFTYGAEGNYQFGTASGIGIGGSDISAWAAAAHVSKLFDQVALSPTLRLSGSYASGDDGSGPYKQFDPLLGDPQRFHGQMDLFAWSNHADVAGRVEVAPLTDTTFGIEYRYARLVQGGAGEWIGSYMNAIGTGNPATNAKDLGHEIDAVFAWRPWVPVELRAGYSALFLGDGAKDVMATFARGKRLPDNAISPASFAQYVFGQATVDFP